MEKIKVIHIITRLDKGGAAENTLLTVKGLNGDRYEAKIIAGCFRRDKEDLKVANTKIEVILIPEMRRVINPFLDILTFFKLYLMIKRERPQIVHTHTSKAGFLGRWAAKLADVPIIIHTPHGHIFYGYFHWLITRFFIFLERITSLITDYIVTLTKRGRKEHLRYRIGPPCKFIPIHSGIERKRFEEIRANREEKKRELGIPLEAKVLGTIGRLEPIKGHLYLLKAAKLIVENPRFQETRFLLVGRGPLRKKLEREISLLGIRKNVQFLGFREDISEILNIFDIFVLPSLNEGMGRVLLEAMLMGKPVVASNVGGIPDIVKDEETGLLVPCKDFKALSERIIELLKNPEKAKFLGRKGKEKAEGEEFTAAIMVKRIEELYERAINEKISSGNFCNSIT